MNRKQIKQAFIDAMGETEFLPAYGKYMNALLKDMPDNAKLYYWNYTFYLYKGSKHTTREELFKAYGYKDLRS